MNPVQITFKELEPSPALRDRIEDECHKLEQFAPDIVSCHVTVSRTESRHHKGNRFLVHIRITLPGAELNSGHATGPDHSHEDAFVATRDSFRAMRRQLEDYERRRRGKVKRHEAPSLASIHDLDQGNASGLLMTDDGREILFHENSMVNAHIRDAQVGDRVRFVEVPGEDGPRASTVHLLTRKRRHQPGQH